MCTNESHALLKRSALAWSALEYVGTMPAYDGLGSLLEMRNCTCGSTLGKTIRLAISLADIEARERLIAAREGIEWDRVDRVWVRGEAVRELREAA